MRVDARSGTGAFRQRRYGRRRGRSRGSRLAPPTIGRIVVVRRHVNRVARRFSKVHSHRRKRWSRRFLGDVAARRCIERSESEPCRGGVDRLLARYGKGFLTGTIDESTTFDRTDFRNIVPRFTAENRKANQTVVDLRTRIAAEKRTAPAQIALACLLAQRPWIVPIPGSTNLSRLAENLGASAVELTASDLREIEDAAARITVEGARFPHSFSNGSVADPPLSRARLRRDEHDAVRPRHAEQQRIERATERHG